MTKTEKVQEYIEDRFRIKLNVVDLKVLGDIIYAEKPKMSDDEFSSIVDLVSKNYGVDILQKTADGRLSRASICPQGRYVVMSYLKKNKMSLKKIGEHFKYNDKCLDHATVLHGIRELQKWCETDKVLNKRVEDINKEINIMLESKSNKCETCDSTGAIFVVDEFMCPKCIKETAKILSPDSKMSDVDTVIDFKLNKKESN